MEMEFDTVEVLKKFFDSWKSNKAVFFATLTWIVVCIIYLLKIDYNKVQVWYSLSEVHTIICSSLVLVSFYIYVIYNRCYIPKAKKKNIGILFCISYSDIKQEKVVYHNFIKPFKEMVNQSSQFSYDVIVLNDYIGEKYLNKLMLSKSKKQIELTLLKKSKCEMLFWGNCLACGDLESSFCKINLNNGISYEVANSDMNLFLKEDIQSLFSPLREINISHSNRTNDFTNAAEILKYVFQYILATTHFMCKHIEFSMNLFEDLRKSISLCNNTSPIITKIKNNNKKHLGLCYAVLSDISYSDFVFDRDVTHLEKALMYMSHPEIDEVAHYKDITMAVCVFKVERNVDKAMAYLDKCNQSHPLVKINKAFLQLYKSCTAKNIKYAYQSYKLLNKLPEDKIFEIEAFVHEEYENDSGKPHLLFLLSMIYLYQENLPLAKCCFLKFCKECKKLLSAKSLSKIFDSFETAFEKVTLSEKEF